MNIIFLIIIWIFGILVLVYLIGYRLFFLRNPKVFTSPDVKNLVSPASGRIGRIIDLHSKQIDIEKGILGKVKILTKDVPQAKYLVQVILQVYDIHYQKMPIDGKIKAIKYTKGKFNNAVTSPLSLRCIENEKNEFLISGKITCKVVQLAGVLARRCVSLVKIDQSLHKGEDMGLIKLGSQTLIILPSVDIKVKTGQKVLGGETIIAKLK